MEMSPMKPEYVPAMASDQKKRLAILIAIAVSAFGVGLVTANYVDRGGVMSSTTGDYDTAYQAGFEAARARLVERGFIMDTTMYDNMPTQTISGTVKDVSGSSLTLEVTPHDPLADVILYTVTVDGATKVVNTKPRSEDDIKADTEAYEKAYASYDPYSADNSTPPSPPSFTVDVPGTISDVKIGEWIHITATDNIPAEGSFVAKQIVRSEPVVMTGLNPLSAEADFGEIE
jgi:hypothetical protein